jgi:hypothetical protein
MPCPYPPSLSRPAGLAMISMHTRTRPCFRPSRRKFPASPIFFTARLSALVGASGIDTTRTCCCFLAFCHPVFSGRSWMELFVEIR